MTNQDNDTAQAFADAAAPQTFVDKAFKELEGLNRFLMGTTPPEIIAIAQAGINAIESCVDRPVEEKEALKALVVFKTSILQFGHPYIFDDTRRFKTEYNEQLSNMVDDCIKHKQTADQIQTELALSIAINENSENMLEKMLRDPASREEVFAGNTVENFIQEIEERLDSIMKDESFVSETKLIARLQTSFVNTIAIVRANPAPAP